MDRTVYCQQQNWEQYVQPCSQWISPFNIQSLTNWPEIIILPPKEHFCGTAVTPYVWGISKSLQQAKPFQTSCKRKGHPHDMPMQAEGGSGSIAPIHSQPSTRRRWVVTALPPRKDAAPTVWEAEWAQSGQHGKSHLQEDSIPGPSSMEQVAIPAMPSQPPQTLGHLSKLNTVKPQYSATVCSPSSDAVYWGWW